MCLFLTLWSPCMPTIISLWIKFYISAEPSRDLASSGLWHMIEASVVSGSPVCESPHMKHQEMAVFHRICSSQPGGGGGGVVVGGLSGAAAALVYSFFCLNWKKKKKKKKVFGELVKEYLRSILSSHSLLHLYMSLF